MGLCKRWGQKEDDGERGKRGGLNMTEWAVYGARRSRSLGVRFAITVFLWYHPGLVVSGLVSRKMCDLEHVEMRRLFCVLGH